MGNPTYIILPFLLIVKHIDTNTRSVYTVVLPREHIIRGKEASTAFTLSDSQIQTIVRTLMPDIYLFQKYRDSYVCEGPEDLEALYAPAEDEESSQVAVSPGADLSN